MIKRLKIIDIFRYKYIDYYTLYIGLEMKIFYAIILLSSVVFASADSRKKADLDFMRATKNFDCTDLKNSQDINALDVYEAFVIENFEGCELLDEKTSWVSKVVKNNLKAPGDKSKILGYFCNLSLITPPLKSIDQCIDPQTEANCTACDLPDYKKAMELKFGKNYKDSLEYRVYFKDRLSNKDRQESRKIVLKYLFNIFNLK